MTIYGLEGFDGDTVLGHRRGRRQHWPVYAAPPPPQPPGVVGWVCPPTAPLTPVRFRGTIGYSCVESPLSGDARARVGSDTRSAKFLVGAGLLLLVAGVVMTREGRR